MTKGETLSVTNSLYYGIRCLSWKGIKVTYNTKSPKYEYIFIGWGNSVGVYNGGGTRGYRKMTEESKSPDPEDY